MRVAVVDYGRGNIHSISKALLHIGYRSELVSEPDSLLRFPSAVIPGVGAYSDAMSRLVSTGMAKALIEYAGCGRPLLGICLGMQVLLSWGAEGGFSHGLDLIPGNVEPVLPSQAHNYLKLPHMGWNVVDICKTSPLLAGVPSGTRFYFIHSYAVFPKQTSHWLASTTYGRTFASVVQCRNVYGTQFHPEKSGPAGLAVLSNFVGLTGEC